MNISGKFLLRVAGTLTCIALTVAALLGAVNGITADKIAAINEAKTAEAMSKVVPVEGVEFKEIDVADASVEAAVVYGTLVSMHEVYDQGDMIGYAVKFVAGGSQGNIEMVVGVDTTGAVMGVSVVDHAETSGIGTKVCNNETGMLDALEGMSMANGEITVNKGTNKIDGVSGATVSSKGVVKGVNGALAAVMAIA